MEQLGRVQQRLLNEMSGKMGPRRFFHPDCDFYGGLSGVVDEDFHFIFVEEEIMDNTISYRSLERVESVLISWLLAGEGDHHIPVGGGW